MLQRRRWGLRIGAGLALAFLVISAVQGQTFAAVVFAILLAVNIRALVR